MQPFGFFDVGGKPPREEVVGIVSAAARITRGHLAERVLQKRMELPDGDAEQFTQLHEAMRGHVLRELLKIVEDRILEHLERHVGVFPRVFELRDARGRLQKRFDPIADQFGDFPHFAPDFMQGVRANSAGWHSCSPARRRAA